MYAEPQDLDRQRLRDELRASWDLPIADLIYDPVGFGTHHYVAPADDGHTWFVNVDDLTQKTWISEDPRQAFEGLGRSFATAAALRSSGLGFVHGPVPRRDGALVATFGDRYAVSVCAYVDGTSNDFGGYASDDERRLVLASLGRMHAATSSIPSGPARRDTLEIPMRDAFFGSLGELSSEWDGGPYADPARRVLAAHDASIRERFAHYDELAEAVGASGRPWVVTHGEPHAGNVMRTRDRGLLLIDWDTAAIAPPERDLWHVGPALDDGWDAYTRTGGVPDTDERALDLYRLWWTLAEIAGCTATLRSSHADDANSRVTWRGFQGYVTGASSPDV